MPDAVQLSPMRRAFRAGRAARVALARVDVNAFIEFCMRDEETGEPVKQGEVHRTWHALLDRHSRLICWASIALGKTQQISVARTLWELGRDSSLRVVIASNAEKQAEKIIRSIAAYIERSKELHEVFPHLKPASAGPWNQSMLTVERTGIAKDPSVQATSIHGNILGARTDLLILDDVLDYENCRTPLQREDLIGWVFNALLGRLSSRGRVVVIGVAQNKEDLMHVLAARPLWRAFRFAVEKQDGSPRWPEKWPASRISKMRATLSPAEGWRQLDCIAKSDEHACIEEAWVQTALRIGEKFTPLTFHRGSSIAPAGPCLLIIPRPWRTVLGVDLAFSEKVRAALSAIVAVLVHPSGLREILSCESGKWHGPTLMNRILSMHRRFNSSAITIEANAGQILLGQWLKTVDEALPLIPYTTGAGAKSLQARVEQLAGEMAHGQWSIPSIDGRARESETALLVRDLLSYSPRDHVPDRVAALCMAMVGIEKGEIRAEWGRLADRYSAPGTPWFVSREGSA